MCARGETGPYHPLDTAIYKAMYAMHYSSHAYMPQMICTGSAAQRRGV